MPRSAKTGPSAAPLAAEQNDDLKSLRRMALKLAKRLVGGQEVDAVTRLLGKSAGVIDGFDTLVEVIVRIIDRERQGQAASGNPSGDPIDEHALEQRIADELDRIAARGGTPGGDPPDRVQP